MLIQLPSEHWNSPIKQAETNRSQHGYLGYNNECAKPNLIRVHADIQNQINSFWFKIILFHLSYLLSCTFNLVLMGNSDSCVSKVMFIINEMYA